MGVVARRAAETALALAETPTFLHLFHLPDELGLVVVRAGKYREEVDQRKARTKLGFVAANTIDPVITLEVALLADSRPEDRLEMPGIDDRQVPSVDHLGAACAIHRDRGTARNQPSGHGKSAVRTD